MRKKLHLSQGFHHGFTLKLARPHFLHKQCNKCRCVPLLCLFVCSVVRVLKDPRSSFDYRTAVGEPQPLEFSQVSGSVAQRAGCPWNTRLGENPSEGKRKIELCATVTENECGRNIENHCGIKYCQKQSYNIITVWSIHVGG